MGRHCGTTTLYLSFPRASWATLERFTGHEQRNKMFGSPSG